MWQHKNACSTLGLLRLECTTWYVCNFIIVFKDPIETSNLFEWLTQRSIRGRWILKKVAKINFNFQLFKISSSADISITLRNRGPDAFKPDKYGEVVIVEQHISGDGIRHYKLKSQSGKPHFWFQVIYWFVDIIIAHL